MHEFRIHTCIYASASTYTSIQVHVRIRRAFGPGCVISPGNGFLSSISPPPTPSPRPPALPKRGGNGSLPEGLRVQKSIFRSRHPQKMALTLWPDLASLRPLCSQSFLGQFRALFGLSGGPLGASWGPLGGRLGALFPFFPKVSQANLGRQHGL